LIELLRLIYFDVIMSDAGVASCRCFKFDIAAIFIRRSFHYHVLVAFTTVPVSTTRRDSQDDAASAGANGDASSDFDSAASLTRIVFPRLMKPMLSCASRAGDAESAIIMRFFIA